MAYSGKYKPKNPTKYTGDSSKVVYRSLWEKHCFKWCDNNPQVLKWSSEEVVIPYLWDVDKRYHRYFVDLKIKFRFAKERGWKFVVWTENTLERMGIKPKSTKALKPYVKRKK